MVGQEFNLGSPKQLQEILFDELGLPKTKQIKTGYTTDADALQWLSAQTEHPLLEHLLRHRDVARLKTTVDGLLQTVADDGRIHTTFNQMVAATGRLSSHRPQPAEHPDPHRGGPRRSAQAFVVGDGYESLLTADYSQIEMRIMAHLSEDDGPDRGVHVRRGPAHLRRVAGRSTSAASRSTRSCGAGSRRCPTAWPTACRAFGLAQQLGITPTRRAAQMETYFERFGGVRDYLRDVVDEARQDGYTETILGRRRYLPDLTSDNRQRREMAERMALNAPIQGSAADIIKVAMLRRRRARCATPGCASRMLLQVHDELVLEVAPGERERRRGSWCAEEMGGAYPLAGAAGACPSASGRPGTTQRTSSWAR